MVFNKMMLFSLVIFVACIAIAESKVDPSDPPLVPGTKECVKHMFQEWWNNKDIPRPNDVNAAGCLLGKFDSYGRLPEGEVIWNVDQKSGKPNYKYCPGETGKPESGYACYFLRGKGWVEFHSETTPEYVYQWYNKEKCDSVAHGPMNPAKVTCRD